MWIELIRAHCGDCSFFEPVLAADLVQLRRRLGVQTPESLEALLRETDGVFGPYGLGLIWPTERIIADNLRFREESTFTDVYMPFDNLLFFADAGNGDQFAFPVLRGGVTRAEVFVWNHEDDSRAWVAPSLETYLEWWLQGTLMV